MLQNILKYFNEKNDKFFIKLRGTQDELRLISITTLSYNDVAQLSDSKDYYFCFRFDRQIFFDACSQGWTRHFGEELFQIGFWFNHRVGDFFIFDDGIYRSREI